MTLKKQTKEQKEYLLALAYKNIVDHTYRKELETLKDKYEGRKLIEKELRLKNNLDYWKVNSKLMEAEESLIDWGKEVLAKDNKYDLEESMDFKEDNRGKILDFLIKLDKEKLEELA
ncbi:hypothetical protein [Orenia marismortui]|uniref:Phage protein n=1 Tax=Orenia marismortui TaxID=46469 RepID=A0A4R8GYR3_9FIRM|nr:hypothetical protein [Orenia marismortui]TDX51667.1 hypothetical protein C7959_11163 [Orenia marismortui]